MSLNLIYNNQRINKSEISTKNPKNLNLNCKNNYKLLKKLIIQNIF